MDRNILKAKWRQFRGKSKILRARLTGNERRRMSGRIDMLVGGAQEKITTTRHKAAREVNRRVAHYQTSIKHRLGSK